MRTRWLALVLLVSGCATTPPATPGPEAATIVPDKNIILATDAKTDVHLMSIGAMDGVKRGDEFMVWRDDEFVAVVVADKVFKDKASVVVKKVDGKSMLKSAIQVGDKVAAAR